MSKTSTPAGRSPGQYDGYIATTGKLEIGRALFIGLHRAVVKHQFGSFKEWDAARNGPHRTPEREFTPGWVMNEGRPSKAVAVEPAPPPEDAFFYGVDWLPEERPLV